MRDSICSAVVSTSCGKRYGSFAAEEPPGLDTIAVGLHLSRHHRHQNEERLWGSSSVIFFRIILVQRWSRRVSSHFFKREASGSFSLALVQRRLTKLSKGNVSSSRRSYPANS